MRRPESDETAVSAAPPTPSGQKTQPLKSSVAARPITEPPPSSDGVFSSEAPQRVGPYQVGQLIGQGGMGRVFAGFDPRLDRPVAIKSLLPQAGQSQGSTELLREARHAARLSHPNIVRLYDVVRVDGADYTIAELVDGESLSQLLQSLPTSRLPLERALEIALAVISALAYAHENDVVHRDVKASNVLIARNGDVKLGDFGIAITVHGLGAVPDTDGEIALTGTYFAMSPEQSRGEYTDARSDLFSFGALLYELLTGVAPFLSSDPATCLRLVREAQPLPLAEVLPAAPVRLSRLLARLLEKHRDDRPESAREVEVELKALFAEVSTARERVRPGAPFSRHLAIGCVRWDVGQESGRVRLDTGSQLEVLNTLEQAVLTAGGSLLVGAGTHAVFCIGYPTAQENNCEVAIRLVAELCTRDQHADATLSAGVDCGLTTLLQRQGLLAAGEAIDRAIMLAECAEPRTVSVTLAAQTLARRFFRFAPIVQEKINSPVYRMLEPISNDAGIEQVSATPLRGRERQLERLDRAFADAAQGVVVTRLVVGEAGVGKSRLVHEWRRNVWESADLVLTAYATPQEQYAPFVPLIRMWQGWFGLEPSADPETNEKRLLHVLSQTALPERLSSVLAFAFGLSDTETAATSPSPEQRRHQLLDAFVSLTLELAEKQLTILVFEDLHFVDRSTLEVLRRLAESPARVRLLIVLSARPEFLPSWPIAKDVARVELEPLSSNDALLLLESLTTNQPLPAHVVRQLVELADGVPLVLEELTRAFRDDTPSSTGAARAPSYYPTSLADSVTRRLAELGPARDLICAAAAVGRECSLELLRAVVDVGEEEFKSRLRRLESAALVHVRDRNGVPTCILAHTLIQEAIKNAMLGEEMQSLCRRIVTVLDAQCSKLVDDEPERFAHLFAAAGAAPRALDLFERAAGRAARTSGYAEASVHLQAALSLLQSSGLDDAESRERRLRDALGPCLMATEGWSAQSVAENLGRARALGDSTPGLGQLWGAWAHGLVTHDSEAVDAALLDVSQLTPSSEQRFAALSIKGVTAFYRGQFSVARRYLEQGTAMLPRADSGETRSTDVLGLDIARAWGCEFTVAAPMHLAWMEVLCGRRWLAERIHGEAEALLSLLSRDAQMVELRHGLYMRVHLGLTMQDYEFFDYSALGSADGSLHRLFELAGSRFLYYRCVAQLGQACGRATSSDPAAVEDLLDTYKRIKSLSLRPMGHVFFASVIAEACLKAGRAQAACSVIEEGTDVAQSEFGRFYAPEAFRVAAQVYLALGDIHAARGALRRARSACLILDAPAETPVLLFEQRIEEVAGAVGERTITQTEV